MPEASQFELLGQLPPCVEVGIVHEIKPKKSAKNVFYGTLILKVRRGTGDKFKYTYTPFYIGPKLWGKFKPLLKTGDLWAIYFRLKGNEKPCEPYYCSASLVDAHMIGACTKSNGRPYATLSASNQPSQGMAQNNVAPKSLADSDNKPMDATNNKISQYKTLPSMGGIPEMEAQGEFDDSEYDGDI